LQHLIGKQLAVGKVRTGFHILHVVLAKDVILLVNAAFHGFRSPGYGRAGVRATIFTSGELNTSYIGKKINV